MSKLRPVSFGIFEGDLPHVQMNVAKAEARLSAAGISAEQHEPLVRVLKQACHEYIIDRMADEKGVTASQVREHFSELREHFLGLHKLLDRRSNPVAKVVLQRAEMEGELSNEQVEQALANLRSIVTAAALVVRKAGPVRRGGGRAALHRRQLQFAKGFVDTFEANGLPMGTSQNSLMAQLLSLCLDAVGEEYKEPENLLAKAAKLNAERGS